MVQIPVRETLHVGCRLIMCGSGPNEGDFTCRMETHHVRFRSH